MAKSASDAFSAALNRNATWSADRTSSDPNFFTTLAKGQSPKILWIGCSDSRIPAEQVLGCGPGDVFVHRNIANVLTPNDLSSLSVIEYAVTHLKVEHAVVCGHTGCGGVAAALGNKSLGVLDTWLHPVKQLRLKNQEELSKIAEGDKVRWLSERNVKQSLETLREHPAVIAAIKERGMKVHGVIYDLEKGKVEELDCAEPEEITTKRGGVFSFL